jgi:hypothetical protein
VADNALLKFFCFNSYIGPFSKTFLTRHFQVLMNQVDKELDFALNSLTDILWAFIIFTFI